MICLTLATGTAVSPSTRCRPSPRHQVALALGLVAVAAVVEEQQVVRLGGVGDRLERGQDVGAGRLLVRVVGQQADAGRIEAAGDELLAGGFHVLDADLERAEVVGVLVGVGADQHGPTVAGAVELVGLQTGTGPGLDDLRRGGGGTTSGTCPSC